MSSEAQAVEIRPSAQDVLEAEGADEIGQRVGRISDNQDDRLRRRLRELGKHLLVGVDVHFEQPQPASRIASIRRAASTFVHPGSDHDQRRTSQVGVISVTDVDGWGQRCAVSQVGRHRDRPLAISIHHDDLTRDAAHD